MALNFLGINPIDALFYTAVINGLLAPPLLVLIMLVANRSDIMGARTNSRATNVIGWLTTFAMSAAAVVLLVNWATGQA
jgi:Mn2+/Fe2+ NRAMP family transporter